MNAKANDMSMNRWTMAAAAAAMLLAACASGPAPTQAPRVEEGADGARAITSASATLICDQPRCPVLTAGWSSRRPGLAVLTVGLPYQKADVTGAQFHFGASQVVTLRVKSAHAPAASDIPATAFDVPLSLIDTLAYASSAWLRVTTADGRAVDETVSTGEQQSDAANAMRQFLRAVDTATGTPPNARTGGGLSDLLK